MRRGTRVGQAYVALTVDGDGMNDEIADSFDDVDFKKIGDEHGKAYSKALQDHLNGLDKEFDAVTERMGNRLSSRLAKAIETDSALDDSVSKTLAKAFDDGRLNKLIEHVGKKAGVTFGTEFDHVVRKEVLDSLEGSLQDAVRSGNLDMSSLVRGVNSGGGQVELLGSAVTDAVKRVEAAQRTMQADAKRALAEQEKQEKAYTRFLGSQERARLADAAKAAAVKMRLEEQNSRKSAQNARDYTKWWTQTLQAIDRADEKAKKELAKRDNMLWDVRRKSASAYAKYLKDLEKGTIDKFGEAVSRNQQGGIGDRMGALLGAGSRNNFLNFFGRSLGNIIGLVDKARTVVSGMSSAFVTGFNSADESANIFQKTLKGFEGAGAAGLESMSAGLSALASSGPAAALGIAVVTVAISALVSVISALTGLVVALTSTIASGLVGAVLVLGAGFVAAAAAGGLLVAAFTSMTDAQKEALKADFHPLKAELTGIGQLMITKMIPYFDNWSKNLQKALLNIAPLAGVMGRAFGRAGAIITKSLSGDGFDRLFKSLRDELPGITVNLSKAFGSFLNGMAGVFAAIMPLVTRFSDYLRRVAHDFDEWANSKQGQNAIVDFADRAVDSLKSLWGAIKEAGGFIKDLLFDPASQNAGNSMFDSLRDSFKGFRDAVDKASKNGDLKKWFDDAIKFGGDLKDVVIALKDAWKKLDNSGVLSAVGTGLKLVADQIDNVSTMLSPFIKAVGWGAPKAISAMQSAMDSFTGSGIIGVLGSIGGAVSTLIGTVKTLLGLQQQASNWKAPSSGHSGLDLLTHPGLHYNNSGGGGKSTHDYQGLYNPRMAAGRMAGRTPASGGSSGGGHHGPNYTIGGLIASGEAALAQTGKDSGGSGGGSGSSGSGNSTADAVKKAKDKWKNPYVKWANSLIYEGPALSKQIAAAIGKVRKQIGAAIDKANAADDLAGANSVLSDAIANIKASAKSTIDDAHSALNSAASSLASASGPKEAARALKAVRRAQKDLTDAIKNQKKIQAAANALASQKVVHSKSIDLIKSSLSGNVDASDILRVRLILNRQNTTLADFAKAREILATKIEAANEKLADAISLRDDYEKTVADATNAFGALTTAQAQTIGGIEQALTATDIVGNLQDRLAKIQHFQEGLRVLLAQGLSDAAYKQIVDAGVEDGSSYVDALIAGGVGAIDTVNNLTGQIGSISDALGTETANRLYQAGVDAAQGLVDGLNSLSDELDAAAAKLGHQIAKAIKEALGIHSPSKVMFDAMDYGVGDGIVGGLDAQHRKVGAAATRLAGRIAVSPEVAAYAASRRAESGTVSGNDQRPFELTVVTPTEDPVAVVKEVMNEMVTRL